MRKIEYDTWRIEHYFYNILIKSHKLNLWIPKYKSPKLKDTLQNNKPIIFKNVIDDENQMTKGRSLQTEDRRHTANKMTLLGCWQTIFHESFTFFAHLVNRGTDKMCIVLSFQGWLYDEQPVREKWHFSLKQIVSLFANWITY